MFVESRPNVLDGIAVPPTNPTAPTTETALFYRPAAVSGVEVLHARFVTHRYIAHVHETWTVALVGSGAAAFSLGRDRHVAHAGSAFLIPPGAVHTGEPVDVHGYSYRVLYVDPNHYQDGADSWLTGHHARNFPVIVNDAHLSAHLGLLHRHIGDPGRALELSETVTGVLAAVADLASDQGSEQSATPPVRVERARQFIEEHWRRDFSLSDLAQATNTSPFHLVRTFRYHLGVTPSGYRRALRLSAAQRLLRQGRPPVDVAVECGFYDQAHLNRHFKLTTGVTPAKYSRSGFNRDRSSSASPRHR